MLIPLPPPEHVVTSWRSALSQVRSGSTSRKMALAQIKSARGAARMALASPDISDVERAGAEAVLASTPAGS